VTGLPDLQIQNEGVCKGCALGKNSRKKFPSSNNRAEGILDIIHSDVCCKMSTPSIGNYFYYATFIDDYSRKTWIYLLKTKDEVFDKFVEFKASVENLTGRKIKVPRTDNGGEYTSNEFKDFCKGEGIKRELTTPYTPQQNGIAKRKNRSIVEAAKAMIHDQNQPMHLWSKASKTIVFVQNKSPHKILGNMTLEEAFTGKKPDLSKLRIFGCPVYIHVPSNKRSKIDPSGRKNTFVGYSETSKGYRIYISEQRKIEVSIDVTFDEEAAFRKSRESHSYEDKEEQEATPVTTIKNSTPEEYVLEEQEESDRHESLDDTHREERVSRKRPTWLRDTLQEVKGHFAPSGSSREKKRP